MTGQTGFFVDERCFWHSGGNYAFLAPVGGLIQPAAAGGLPENPETKRRLKNLVEVTGLVKELRVSSAAPATEEDLRRIHPADFLTTFRNTALAGGGETGLRAPYGPDGYEIASLSAGLVTGAMTSVLNGTCRNAYALSRPPGHHCLPDWQNGFCLLANIAIAIEACRAAGLAERFAVLDWDVHHGNGTEAIFYEDPNVLTVSIHQERNYPLDTGDFADRGRGAGQGANLNIPLPPGTGHKGYMASMERIALPAIRSFKPDVLIIACGLDAAAFDPLSRMLASADTFRQMTRQVMDLASDICEDRLVMAHEGGYSEMYVPFCGHAVLAEMAESAIDAPDPFASTLEARQPSDRFNEFVETLIDEMAEVLA